MAVQQNKKSPSKRGMHRSHNALTTPGTAIEPRTPKNRTVRSSLDTVDLLELREE